MSTTSSDTVYTKLTEMDINTDQKLLPVAFKPYSTFKTPYMVSEIRHRLREGLNSSKTFVPICIPIVLPDFSLHKTKRLCIDWRKLNAQLPIVSGNETGGVVTLIR